MWAVSGVPKTAGGGAGARQPRADAWPRSGGTCAQQPAGGGRWPAARHARPLAGGGHPDTPTARGRQKPPRVAVGLPGLAEPRPRLVRQGHRAVLGACDTAPVHEPVGTIHVGHGPGGARWPAQAPGVKGRQAGPRPREASTLEEHTHCVPAEDDRPRGLMGWPHAGQRGPVPLARVRVAERDAPERHGTGSAGRVLRMLERERKDARRAAAVSRSGALG